MQFHVGEDGDAAEAGREEGDAAVGKRVGYEGDAELCAFVSGGVSGGFDEFCGGLVCLGGSC